MERYSNLIKVAGLLKTCGYFVRGLAWVLTSINLLLILLFWAAVPGATGGPEILAGLVSMVVSLVLGLAIWIVGLLVCATGEACLALADIADNSAVVTLIDE